MTDNITLPRSVVEQALEALFMYKPMVTGVTFQHGLDAMQALRAALEQPQVEQPVAWIRGLPEEATHIAAAKAKVRSGGQIDISTHAFKYDDGVLMVYVTDNDNEYPGWRKAADAFYHLNFPVIPISTHPQPHRQPLTDQQIHDCFQHRHRDKATERRMITRAIERAHGITGEQA